MGATVNIAQRANLGMIPTTAHPGHADDLFIYRHKVVPIVDLLSKVAGQRPSQIELLPVRKPGLLGNNERLANAHA